MFPQSDSYNGLHAGTHGDNSTSHQSVHVTTQTPGLVRQGATSSGQGPQVHAEPSLSDVADDAQTGSVLVQDGSRIVKQILELSVLSNSSHVRMCQVKMCLQLVSLLLKFSPLCLLMFLA
ncbi:hypothetical protein V6N11_031014 [Hibiscus sabdariffa]|uniref:Uncharacterized protein n=2 Tax=Hibiscus sabdariffa TaxID=183260 RepID=A0ABR2A514_9ROSI